MEDRQERRRYSLRDALHSFFRKLAQGICPSIVLLLMGVLGYVSERGTEGQTFQTSHNMCWLVAGLYLFSAILQVVGVGIIFNLNKKTLAKMNAELDERRAATASAEVAATDVIEGVVEGNE